MPEFRMLVGLPGSGKSYYSKEFIKKYPEFKYFSSDEYRKEHKLTQTDISFWDDFNNEVKNALLSNNNVLYDATNLSSKYRKALLNSLPKNVIKICIVMATNLENCIMANRSELRDHIVPDSVILEYYKHFQFPQYYEGWDEISIHMTYPMNLPIKSYEIENVVDRLFNYNQNNHWHKFTLGEHMQKVGNYLLAKYNDKELALAGYVHDIGKPYVATLGDDGESHYKYHDNVGAYESMFIKGNFDRVRVAQMIALHMNAHNPEWRAKYEQKANKPGYEILADVFKLCEADDKNYC